MYVQKCMNKTLVLRAMIKLQNLISDTLAQLSLEQKIYTISPTIISFENNNFY